MAKHRTVNTHFWDDSYIENLSPNEILLFLFLITNPQTNIAGSYEITVKRMHERTRLPAAKILIILEKFERDGKFIYKDNWMLAVNGIAHQKTETPTIKTGIEQIINASPGWVRDRVSIDYPSLCIEPLLLIPIVLDSIQSNSIPFVPPETEQPKPSKSKRKAQTTIPDDFGLTDPMRLWFAEHCPSLDIERELEKFKTRCEAKGTLYKDWPAGWRTQMLNAEEWSGNGKPKAETSNGYDPKKDIMSPHYAMPPSRHDFDSAADEYFEIHDDGTREKYEQMKKNWLSTSWAKGFEHEIEEYERGYKFRKRFGEEGSKSVGADTSASRGAEPV